LRSIAVVASVSGAVLRVVSLATAIASDFFAVVVLLVVCAIVVIVLILNRVTILVIVILLLSWVIVTIGIVLICSSVWILIVILMFVVLNGLCGALWHIFRFCGLSLQELLIKTGFSG